MVVNIPGAWFGDIHVSYRFIENPPGKPIEFGVAMMLKVLEEFCC